MSTVGALQAPKQASAFYPPQVTARVRANARQHPWAAALRDEVVQEAAPWLGFGDEALWAMMFGHTITRSWMVWSNGQCPACRGQTPMYTWQIDALARPWKVRCPHCGELFPSNDFQAFHASGLDRHGVFDPARADRRFLANAEHPDPRDPLHTFGVDDGEGYVEGDRRWRFIGAYLIYGQWKQLVLGGINRLSAVYVLTGEGVYAHKAAVLLDRVADLYPTFDFEREGLAYEKPHSTGYVSTWHDACEETRELAEAYDRIFPAIDKDWALVEFLAARAARHGLANPKRTAADVQRNIEDGILRDVLAHPEKIHSNYPRQENALLVVETVLGWPANRARVDALLDGILDQATAVDGVTGEKGLAGYSTIGPQAVAQILGLFDRLEPGFLAGVYRRHPRLRDLFRFHVDTHCLGRYYPHVGDSGAFTRSVAAYAGASFTTHPGLAPSSFTFLLRLWELTGDPAFVQVLYAANGRRLDGLPYDLFTADAEGFREKVRLVISREGDRPRPGSANKEAWHLGILRSGEGERARALWLHYAAGGRHSHRDGLNLGLFACGMDLLPELGYPPVQFGGWDSPRARWYRMTAGHNTVVVDGRDQQEGAGRTVLWADGPCFHAIGVTAPSLYDIRRYERTAMLVDVSARDAYVLDLFRVAGGADHARFLHSGFGSLQVRGLPLAPAVEYGHGTQMRTFRGAPAAAPGWSADWTLADRYDAQPGAQVHLRCVDLTEDAEAYAAEAWLSLGYDERNAEAWVPRLMVRRRGTEPLESTFVALLEPHEGEPFVRGARRVALQAADGGATLSPHSVAVEITLADGRQDLIAALDPEHEALVAAQPEWDVHLQGALGWVRRDGQGRVARAALVGSGTLRAGALQVTVPQDARWREVLAEPGGGALT
ncbi:MAG: heparinase II/III family protein [Candidatus Latescibacterota bacterium]